MAYSVGNKMGNKTALLYGLFSLQQNGLIIWLNRLATKRATKRPYYMAYSIDNKTALMYGLFNWQQNGFIIWLIQLATKRATKQLSILLIQLATQWPYCMAYSVGNKTGNKTALIYGLFDWQQNGQQNGLIIWLIQLITKRP